MSTKIGSFKFYKILQKTRALLKKKKKPPEEGGVILVPLYCPLGEGGDSRKQPTFPAQPSQ
jgi:hypothetical protein